MGIVYHVKFIHDYCFEAGNSIITNSGVYQSVCLVIVSINDDLAEGRRQAFSMVQTAISKSAHVALILLPPKKPTTRIEPSSARLLHMLFGPSRSSDWSGHLRSPWTTLRSQRTFSCTRATYGSTITALASLWKSSRLSSRTVPLLVNPSLRLRDMGNCVITVGNQGFTATGWSTVDQVLLSGEETGPEQTIHLPWIDRFYSEGCKVRNKLGR